MSEYSREGHRSRIRQNYIANGTNGMSDANLLELYLSTIIPRKDVKQVSYDLLNKFGTLENVFSASPKQLGSVKGIGENTAIIIGLYNEFCSRLDDDNSIDKIVMTKSGSRLQYAKKAFVGETKEKSIFLTIDNQDKISGTFVFDGYFGTKKEDKIIIVEKLLQTGASQCIFYHFDPNSSGNLTNFDLNTATEMRNFLATIHTFILDWIVIGADNMESISRSKHSKRIGI